MRMTAVEFQSSKFFDNILVSTMKYMENFAEKTRDDKSQFMKGLLRVLPQFPERVLLRKVCASMATQESCASSTVS
jgi:SCY1-like protein 2